MADTNITCDPGIVRAVPVGLLSYSPAHGRDTSLDFKYAVDPGVVELTPLGEVFTVSIVCDPGVVTTTPVGIIRAGITIACSAGVVTTSPAGRIIIESSICGFVAWSKIGKLDFTIDKTNVAGKRPVDWNGCVYEVLQLDKSAVIYGENGVSVLTPVEKAMGMSTIHRIGVLNKLSVAGSKFEHYFVDKEYKLYRLTKDEGLVLLDYSEYLTVLTDPKLSLDVSKGLLYISDGTYGFVYGTMTKSFGEGPINVTGVGYRDGTFYSIAPDDIVVPSFSITTDIYDLGSRKTKTIMELEVGTDLTNNLQAMIESRKSNKAAFIQSRWVLVNPSGRAIIPCYGIEFRFNIRSVILEYFELDYIKVIGYAHEFGYVDAVN